MVRADAPGKPTARATAPDAVAVKGLLSEIEGVRVLRVWGTPHERGYAHGYHMARDILALFEGYLKGESNGGKAAAYQMASMMVSRIMKIEPRYEQELRGMREGIEARLDGETTVSALKRKLNYTDLVAINCIPDSSRLGCSSFAAWGRLTKEGHTLAGRNLDWIRIDALEDNQIILCHLREPGNKSVAGWVSVTWPGLIGCLTGMNERGVTVSMHDAPSDPPEVPAGFTPRAFALRDAIEAAHSSTTIAERDILKVLRHRRVAVGNIVSVTTPFMPERSGVSQTGPALAIEYDGVTSRSGGVTLRSSTISWAPARTRNRGCIRLMGGEMFQICTNHYRQRGAAVSCDRYKTIKRRLGSLESAGKMLDVEGAWKILDG
ncbi:MAG: C45 family autoproteolytic acyltransferase/hydrolase, partial [Phycisphaerae bacterium]